MASPLFPDLSWNDCLRPDWRVAPRVRALVSTRNGGRSAAPYGRWSAAGGDAPGGLNLGRHTGDEPADVEANRARLLALTGQPRAAWLEQVHGTKVVRADAVLARAAELTADPAADPVTDAAAGVVRADASVTDVPGAVCVVMVADCMPVLFCDPDGRAVGAAHAGWRGLVAGIIEDTAQQVATLAGIEASRLRVYLGPAIGPAAFEVGADVEAAFAEAATPAEREASARAFVAIDGAPGKYHADLYVLARLRAARLGITEVAGGGACTFTDRERYYSYRRDRVTGRMAAMIWLDA
ncbi:peptidoglycan editing factor PgeF [Burkholderia plantarii]|uniref:peptidoglycan editing factor PgeF n=1 Tax=Burkholderia plantarii TaxID=41899 RepID=UPI0018DAFCBE|nr:peptidoglycan editing factor PgeF [Burkholderia plantarii]MBI0328286.1 peptidoglycan editing factor PgeF [Burkholderia plantarii]